MAGPAAISHASESLQAVLDAAITVVGDFAGTTIDLRSPHDIGTPAVGTNIVSLWLYQVERFGEVENAPARFGADGRLIPSPLPLKLHYLLTPLSADVLTTQRLMGLGMQALHDQSRIAPEFTHADLNGEDDEPLALHLLKNPFEDALRIWQALGETYRLSASYAVQYVAIESRRSLPAARPVIDRKAEYQQIVGVS
ncbi:MAG: DUF4255 domain-containing protein [Yoonia sp.]